MGQTFYRQCVKTRVVNMKDEDKEVRREVAVNKVTVSRCISEKFEYFLSWRGLVIAFILLKWAVINFRTKQFVGNICQTFYETHRAIHIQSGSEEILQRRNKVP